MNNNKKIKNKVLKQIWIWIILSFLWIWGIINTCNAFDYSVFASLWWILSTEINLKVEPWTVTIFAPDTVSFGNIIASSETGLVVVDTSTITWSTPEWSMIEWAYFWIRDLESRDNWYSVQLSSADFILGSNNNVKIDKKHVSVQLTWTWWTWIWNQWWIFLLDWDFPPEVESPVLWWSAFSIPATIISRSSATTPTRWRIWMYWVQPIFNIVVPKYQQIGVYTSSFSFTYIEN